MLMTELYVIIKVNQKNVRDVWKTVDTPFLIVRLQDMICSKSYKFNKTYEEIKNAGSINKFLNTDKNIILSLIMRDEMIRGFTPEKYIEAIKTLKPSCFTSVDGWTYEGDIQMAEKEITRCVLQTSIIMKECPDVIPIGQIKGCS